MAPPLLIFARIVARPPVSPRVMRALAASVLLSPLALSHAAATPRAASQPEPDSAEPATAAAPEPGESAEPTGRARRTRTSRVAHIRLTGDLDTIACVERLRGQLSEALDDDATLLLLEIDADRARPDILLALAGAIEEAEMPTIGFLIDQRDERVSAPCLALALLVADRVAIDPRTAVRFRRGDWAADLLPEDLPADAAIEEFRVAVQEALAAREIDPTLANAWLPDPEASDGDPIDPRTLDALGIGAIIAQTPAQVCRAVGHRGTLPRPTEIDTSLAPARDEVAHLIRLADDAIEQSRRGLDLRNQRPDDREVTVHDHRRAGQAALDRLTHASAAVDRAEEFLREYPEILLSPPPGRTDVGTTRHSLRSAWRYRLDDLREDIDYWRQRAQDSASR